MSSDRPLVSVVVPAYNAASSIGRTLESLCAQTYRPLEVVVVDDGSTDGTAQMVQDFACRAEVAGDVSLHLIRQSNTGRGGARAAGVAAATGEFVGFVDADDHVEAEFYACLVEAALRAEDVDVCVARYQNVTVAGERGHVYAEGDARLFGGSLMDAPELMDQVEASLCNKLFRRGLFEADVDFPPGKDFEDLATTYRLLLRARRIEKVDAEPMYFYTQGGPVSVMAACDDRYNDLVDAVATTIADFRQRGVAERFGPQLIRLALRHLVFARFGDFFIRNTRQVTGPYLDRVYRLLDSELPGWRASSTFRGMCGSWRSRLLVGNAVLLKAYVGLRARS